MSEEKTEKPTDKKLEDSALKGQAFKTHDAIAATVVFFGIMELPFLTLSKVDELFNDFIRQGNDMTVRYALDRIIRTFLEITIPYVGLCIVATVIPSLIQSKGVLAFEAVKFEFDSLNPVNGFKKIFSMKTVKELVKALLYLGIFTQVIYLFFLHFEKTLVSLVNVQLGAISKIWIQTATTIILLCLLAFAFIIILDALVDYHLYIKDQRMDKHEVKQEYKEQEGNAEVKSRRRELHQELLSAQEKNDVEQSNFILANPTHLAIGIYANADVVPIPFVSLHAKGPKALAIIRYAERHGTPVVRDKVIVRRLFPIVKRYAFIPIDMIEPVFNILGWLREVELAHAAEQAEQAEPTTEAEQTTQTEPVAQDHQANTPNSEPDSNEDRQSSGGVISDSSSEGQIK